MRNTMRKLLLGGLLFLIGGCTENPLKEDVQQPPTTPRLYPATFDSNPRGAEVAIFTFRGDSVVGMVVTNDTISLSEGQYRYVVSKSGFKTKVGSFPVYAGNVVFQNIDLEALPAPPAPPTGTLTSDDTVDINVPVRFFLSTQNTIFAAAEGVGEVLPNGSFTRTFSGADANRLATQRVVLHGVGNTVAVVQKTIFVRGGSVVPPPEIIEFSGPVSWPADSTFYVTIRTRNAHTVIMTRYGQVPPQGRIALRLDRTETLTLLAYGSASPTPATASWTVNITGTPRPPAPNVTLAVDSVRVVRGSVITLTTTARNTEYTIVNPIGTFIAGGSGVISDRPLYAQRYQAIAFGPGGWDSSNTVYVEVIQPGSGGDTTLRLNVTPLNITAGQQVRLQVEANSLDSVLVFPGFGKITLQNGYWSAQATPIQSTTYAAYGYSGGHIVRLDTARVTVTIPPNTVGPMELLSPGNGATGLSLTPTFYASTALGANRYLWELWPQVGSQPIQRDTLSQPLRVVTSPLDSGTTYRWRMRGLNTLNGVSGPWTEFWSFTTISQPPPPGVGVPSFITPAFGQNDVPVDITFRWRRGQNAPVSWLQVRANSGDTLFTVSTTDTLYRHPVNLPPGTQLVAFLRGQNANQYSPWSSQHPFRTVGTPPPPPTTQLVIPDTVESGVPFPIGNITQNGVSGDLSNYGPVPLNGVVYTHITQNTFYVLRVKGLPGTMPAYDSGWVYVRQRPEGCFMDMNARVNGVLSATIRRDSTARIRIYGGNLGTGNCTGGGVHFVIPVDQARFFQPENVSWSGNLQPGYGGPLWDGSALHLNGNTINPGQNFWIEFEVRGRTVGVAEIRATAYTFEPGGPWESNPVDITVIP